MRPGKRGLGRTLALARSEDGWAGVSLSAESDSFPTDEALYARPLGRENRFLTIGRPSA